MKITYKVKHYRDFTEELRKAKQVAEIAVKTHDFITTKHVKHIGLTSVISGRIIRKYQRNKKVKKVSSVKLTIWGRHTKPTANGIYIPCLKLEIPFDKECEKINQLEVGEEYVYVTVTKSEKPLIETEKHIGVDLNTTGHCAVVAVNETGKIYKLGKRALFTHKKYHDIRRKLQKKGLFKVVKRIKSRESRIVRDLNHKISRYIVDLAIKEKGGVQLEKLEGIRNSRKGTKKFKYALHSWSFYQLQKFIEYKALLAGIPVSYIDPRNTSKICSKCGAWGYRNDKVFTCKKCDHVENADANAAFNIGISTNLYTRSRKDRDLREADTATAQEATPGKQAASKIAALNRD